MSEADGNNKDPHPTPPEPQIDESTLPTLDAASTPDSSRLRAFPAATRTAEPKIQLGRFDC